MQLESSLTVHLRKRPELPRAFLVPVPLVDLLSNSACLISLTSRCSLPRGARSYLLGRRPAKKKPVPHGGAALGAPPGCAPSGGRCATLCSGCWKPHRRAPSPLRWAPRCRSEGAAAAAAGGPAWEHCGRLVGPSRAQGASSVDRRVHTEAGVPETLPCAEGGGMSPCRQSRRNRRLVWHVSGPAELRVPAAECVGQRHVDRPPGEAHPSSSPRSICHAQPHRGVVETNGTWPAPDAPAQDAQMRYSAIGNGSFGVPITYTDPPVVGITLKDVHLSLIGAEGMATHLFLISPPTFF